MTYSANVFKLGNSLHQVIIIIIVIVVVVAVVVNFANVVVVAFLKDGFRGRCFVKVFVMVVVVK